jgi:hypothetical protein
MEIRKFNYKSSLREVIITNETEDSLFGYDISHINDEKEKNSWREKTKDIDMGILSEQQQKDEYQKINALMKYYRHFKKNQIQEQEKKDEK